MKKTTVGIVLISLLLVGCGREVFTGKREARGVWMSRFEYAGRNPEVAKSKIRTTFERARAARFNMVFFQVRGNGDALYRSSLEPWAESLSDSLGKDPGWDPLEFALGEARRLGLEFHVWVNTFPYWRGAKQPAITDPPQPFQAHPDWIVCDANGKPMTIEPPSNEYIWASPGIPAVRAHVIAVVSDVTRRYDVDGIHFDYIRYPENSPVRGYSHDSVSLARFNTIQDNPKRLAWDDWQRDQVNQFVADAYHAITTIKPWMKVSASVIGKYSGTGWTAYHAVYQDPRQWMETGKIDFIIPMVYWERTHPSHPFVPLITEWQDRVAYERQVLPGLAVRLIEKFGYDEISAQVRETRKRGLPGVVFYSASGLNRDWGTLAMNEFPYWALPPRMPWKDSTAPPPPKSLSVTMNGSIATLRWELPSGSEPLQFIIYRFGMEPFDRNDAYNIAAVTGYGATSYADTLDASGLNDVAYAVSAVNRLGTESDMTPSIRRARLPSSVASK